MNASKASLADHIRKWSEFSHALSIVSLLEADAVFVHGWGDLFEELLGTVAEVYRRTNAKHIILNGEPLYDGNGSPGYATWKQALMQQVRISEDCIHRVTPARHTLEEAQGFIVLAEKLQVRRAVVVSVPQHIGRAFLTDLGVLLARGSSLHLMPTTVRHIDWYTPITVYGLIHTEHAEQTTRLGRLMAECARIMYYRERYEAGDPAFVIASIEEGLAHLRAHEPTH